VGAPWSERATELLQFKPSYLVGCGRATELIWHARLGLGTWVGCDPPKPPSPDATQGNQTLMRNPKAQYNAAPKCCKDAAGAELWGCASGFNYPEWGRLSYLKGYAATVKRL